MNSGPSNAECERLAPAVISAKGSDLSTVIQLAAALCVFVIDSGRRFRHSPEPLEQTMKAKNQSQIVHEFLKRHQGVGYCDDCLEDATQISRYTITYIVSTLALFPNEFCRVLAICPQSTCRSERTRRKLITTAI